MLRITLQQMRLSIGRLVAAGLAIALGTGFVAATLIASATMENTAHNAMTASLAQADAVVYGEITAELLEQTRRMDGVAAADPGSSTGFEISAGGSSEWVSSGVAPSDPRLEVGSVIEGADPQEFDEISLSEAVAERLSVGVGDTVTLRYQTPLDDNGTEWDDVELPMTITGLLDGGASYFATGVELRLSSELMGTIVAELGSVYNPQQMLVVFDDGVGIESVRAELLAADSELTVMSKDEVAEQRTASLTGSDVAFTVLMLGFAAVALSVAALVISNTFQVLVAQRARTLALLRCVGASRPQIRSSVLIEAAILGVGSSVLGLALGTAVVQAAVRVVGDRFTGVPLDTGLNLSWTTALVTLGVGIAVTCAAALVPAHAATRVAPLVALRPMEGELTRRAGVVRAAFALVMVIGGCAALVLGAVISQNAVLELDSDAAMLLGLAVGVLGGITSLVGLLLGSVFVVPMLIRGAGALIGRAVPARIATANAARNPRRTAATTNALVIGVALVVMMSTGALAARASLSDELNSQYPVDVSLYAGVDALTPSQLDAVTATDGVELVATGQSVAAELRLENADVGLGFVVAVEQIDHVVRDASQVSGLSDSTVIINAGQAASAGISEGDAVSLKFNGGLQTRDFTARLTGIPYDTMVITEASMADLAPDSPANIAWLRLSDSADPREVLDELQASLTELTALDPRVPVLEVQGAAEERAAFDSVINGLLAVVVALLAVAVVIALIGVANTLSLSVLERRRENGMLRSMGLTTGQLRGMLAIEGLLIAGVGALVGAVAGLIYGWAGTAVILAGLGDVAFPVPWRDIAIVAAVALVAGLLASVLPARTAVRVSPVEALATD